MSDRGNIVFCKNGEDSVVVSSYYGGLWFVCSAIDYVIELRKEYQYEIENDYRFSTPLSRLEPAVIVVDFICKRGNTSLFAGADKGLYLYRNEDDVYGDVYRINLENPEESYKNENIKYFLEARF